MNSDEHDAILRRLADMRERQERTEKEMKLLNERIDELLNRLRDGEKQSGSKKKAGK